MVSSSIMSKSVYLPLIWRPGVWAVLALSAVSFLIPASSESLVIFQVFKATVQLDTELPGKAVMASQLDSNNATLSTGDKYEMFYLVFWKYIPASNLSGRQKLECDWMSQASAVWKHTYHPFYLIKSQHNARYDVSVCNTMTDLLCITTLGSSWEEPARAPTPPW